MNIVTKTRLPREIAKCYLMGCNLCLLSYLWLTRTVFSWLLKKAVSMALWTKASLCGKSSLSEQSLPRTPSWQKQNQCNLRNLRLKNSCQFVLIRGKNTSCLPCPRVLLATASSGECLSGKKP